MGYFRATASTGDFPAQFDASDLPEPSSPAGQLAKRGIPRAVVMPVPKRILPE
ncbi:hypothetical protein LI291_13235 [Intestinibacillus massiliensis]|nr:hypothetical protein [Intestinibacillus massiliensis]